MFWVALARVRVLGVAFMVGVKWSLELELESGFESLIPLKDLKKEMWKTGCKRLTVNGVHTQHCWCDG